MDDEKKLRSFYDLRMGDIVKEALARSSQAASSASLEETISGIPRSGCPRAEARAPHLQEQLLLPPASPWWAQEEECPWLHRRIRHCRAQLLVVTAPNNHVAGLPTSRSPAAQLGRANNVASFSTEKSMTSRSIFIAREVPGKDGETNRKAPRFSVSSPPLRSRLAHTGTEDPGRGEGGAAAGSVDASKAEEG